MCSSSVTSDNHFQSFHHSLILINPFINIHIPDLNYSPPNRYLKTYHFNNFSFFIIHFRIYILQRVRVSFDETNLWINIQSESIDMNQYMVYQFNQRTRISIKQCLLGKMFHKSFYISISFRI